MNNIKVIMNQLDVRELLLSVTGCYSKDKVKIKHNETTNDVIVTADYNSFIDKIYGRKIQDKYYFARHEFISKENPDIDYYDEFFSNGNVLF